MHPFEDILQVNEGTEEQREKNNDLIEGDIKKDPDAKGDGNVKRNALRNRKNLWHTRDIAYTIKQDGDSAQDKDMISTFKSFTEDLNFFLLILGSRFIQKGPM